MHDRPAPGRTEDAERAVRRASLRSLLDRMQRMGLTETETAALRQHVETETRDADTARAVARSNLRHVQTLVPDLDTADRIRAEAQRDRDQHAAVLAEVLRHFVHKGHPGEPCLQTGWIPVKTVEKWRSVIAPTVERPWWQQVAEAQKAGRTAEAAIERMRDAFNRHQQGLLTTAELYASTPPDDTEEGTEDPEALRAKVTETTSILRRVRTVTKAWATRVLPHSEAHRLLTEVRAAFDGTEQPAAKRNRGSCCDCPHEMEI